MRINNRILKYSFTLYLALLVSACDDSSCDCAADGSTVYVSDSIVQIDATQNNNQSVDLLLYFPTDEVSNINWQQISGPSVELLANTSKVSSFSPSQPGEYSFNVSFTLNGTINKTLTHSLLVKDDTNKLAARLSHAVLAENQVSLRTSLDSTIDQATLQWQQTAGPKVTLQDSNNGSSNEQLAIFFDAPTVGSDTIITFTVTAEDDNGHTYSDSVAVLVEKTATIDTNAYFSDRVADAFVYNSTSPYAEDLVNCVYSNSLTSSCTLAKTPLIASEFNSSATIPTVESIMDRVVVSHQWMGDRFKDYIENNDDNNDIKRLLRATTAIVISYDIRPSFYWAATGAIYLDPENFWLTPNERDTINEAADYRSGFGNDLQFVMPWRYVKDNAYANNSFSKTVRQTRSLNDLLYSLHALLYHELAHANDFFPSTEWYIHSNNTRVLDAATSDGFESDSLAISFPLTSQEMYHLAQVSFSGETADTTQTNYLPDDITGFFSNDSASDYYAYSSTREDYAMLFEELMMQNRFDIQRDVAITNQPTGDYISATDYIVSWGQRGRIGDDNLRDRVLYTAEKVLPEFDSETAMSLVPAPTQMTVGNNWVENLTISPVEPSMLIMERSLNSFYSEDSTVLDTTNASVLEPTYIPVHNRVGYYQKPLPNH